MLRNYRHFSAKVFRISIAKCENTSNWCECGKWYFMDWTESSRKWMNATTMATKKTTFILLFLFILLTAATNKRIGWCSTMNAHANPMTFLTFNCDCMVLINDFISSALLSAVDEAVLRFVLIICLRFSLEIHFSLQRSLSLSAIYYIGYTSSWWCGAFYCGLISYPPSSLSLSHYGISNIILVYTLLPPQLLNVLCALRWFPFTDVSWN